MGKRDNVEERKALDGTVRYRVRIEMKGHPRISKTFATRTMARRWKHRTETEIIEGRYFKTAEAQKHTVSEMVDRYIRDVLPRKTGAEKWQQHQFLWWKDHLGHLSLADLTPAAIAESRDLLATEKTIQGKKRAPATIVRYLAALSHACSVGVKEWGWLNDNPVSKVLKPREPRGRIRFLSPEEQQRLLATCRESICPFLHAIVVLALATGMRQGEILHLTWADVDFERESITIHETKNGDRRVVPLKGYAKRVIMQHFHARKKLSPLLFPSNRLLSVQPYDIRSAWNNAVKKAQICNFRFHDLRHTAASELAMSGASLMEIADILGHKSPHMVKRYAHLSELHTASIVERMNEKMFG